MSWRDTFIARLLCINLKGVGIWMEPRSDWTIAEELPDASNSHPHPLLRGLCAGIVQENYARLRESEDHLAPWNLGLSSFAAPLSAICRIK